jgi:folate-binding protein YgfZ
MNSENPGFQESCALLQETMAWRRLEHAAIALTGPDARSFLQGQLTQDIASLAPGEHAWSFLLEPEGRLGALLRVLCLSDELFLLDMDAGALERSLERLSRYLLRVKVSLELQPNWQVIALRGPRAVELGSEALSLLQEAENATSSRGAIPVSWPGFSGVDLFWIGGASLELDIPRADPEAWEACRIQAGEPKEGHELTPGVLPHATGLVDRAISFTKGCYTGQELVARIDSRGAHVPERLVFFQGETSPGEIPVGVCVEGKQVGTITSAAPSPKGGWIALGYLHRRISTPCTVQLRAQQPSTGVPEGSEKALQWRALDLHPWLR